MGYVVLYYYTVKACFFRKILLVHRAVALLATAPRRFMKFNSTIFLFLFITIFLFSHPIIAEEFTEDSTIYDEAETSEIIRTPEGIEIPDGMVYVPDGYFVMENDDSLAEEEKPSHQV